MHESKGQDAAAEPRGARDQLSGLEVHRIGRIRQGAVNCSLVIALRQEMAWRLLKFTCLACAE